MRLCGNAADDWLRPLRGKLSPAGSAASACRHDGPCRMIRPEVVRAIDRQQIGKTRAGAIHPAFDGPNRAVANGGGLLVGEPRRTNENEGFALIGRQFRERHTKFFELDPALLLRMRFE